MSCWVCGNEGGDCRGGSGTLKGIRGVGYVVLGLR